MQKRNVHGKKLRWLREKKNYTKQTPTYLIVLLVSLNIITNKVL